MDESEDHGSRASNVPESSITVTTVINTTETVIEEIVQSEDGEIEEKRVSISEKVVMEEDGGEVMVEVFESEVLVDGVRRNNGNLGSDELLGCERGDSLESENLGNGEGVNGGKDDDLDALQVASREAEDLENGPSHESDHGSGCSLPATDDSRGGKAPDVDMKEVVEKVVEGALERISGDEGGVTDMELPHDDSAALQVASSKAEDLENGPSHESDHGSGCSLPATDDSQGCKAPDVDTEEVVEKVVEGALERISGDEGGVTAIELPDSVEVRSDEVDNAVQHSTSQITPMADENRDINPPESVEAVKEDGGDKDFKVVECTSIASEPRSKEQIIPEEGDERGISEVNTHDEGNDLPDGTVIGGMVSIKSSDRDDGSRCIESSVDLSSCRCENEVVAEEQIKLPNHSVDSPQLEVVSVKIDGNIVNQSADDHGELPEKAVLDIQDKVVADKVPESLSGRTETGNDSELTGTIIDNVVTNEEAGNDNKLTAISGENALKNDGCVDAEEKAENMVMDDALEAKDRLSENETSHFVEDEKSSDYVGSSDLNPREDVLDAPEIIAGVDNASEAPGDAEEKADNMVMDDVLEAKDRLSENETLRFVEDEKSSDYVGSSDLNPREDVLDAPEIIAGVDNASEAPGDAEGKAENMVMDDVLEAKDRLSENETSHFLEDEKSSDYVGSSELNPREDVLDAPEIIAGVDNASEAPGDAEEKAENMVMDDVLEAKDRLSENETSHFVDDEKSSDYVGSSDFNPREDVLDTPEIIAGVDNVSKAPGETKIVEGDVMDIDVVLGSPSHSENQKFVDTEKNVDLRSPVECQVDKTSVVGTDIDASDPNSEKQGMGYANPQNDLKSNNEMILGDQDSEDSRMGTTTAADETSRSKDLDPAAQSFDSPEAVAARCSPNDNIRPVACVSEVVEPTVCKSENENVEAVSMDNEDETRKPLDPVTSASVDQEVEEDEDKTHKMDQKLDEEVEEDEDKTHKMDEKLDMGSPILETQDSRQNKNGDYETREAHELPPQPDESLVKGVAQGLESEGDDVTRAGSNVEDIWELEEQAASTEKIVSLENASPDEDETTKLSDPFQVGSNVEDIEEIQEQAQIVSLENASPDEDETTKLSDPFQVVSIVEGIEQVQEQVPDTQQVVLMEHASPIEEETSSPVADSDASPEEDAIGECEDHAAYEQPPLPDESLVKGVDHGPECEPSLGDCSDENPRDAVDKVGSDVEDVEQAREQASDGEHVESSEEQDPDDEPVSDSPKSRSKEEKKAKRASLKPGNVMKDNRISYQLPPENEGEFSVFDLVWGKVKSHPWWPGQIFHPSDSSEKAMKYYRKDCYLVAYFGDRSFAWNEASVLKPFRKYFTQEVKQSNSESFQNAVNCALAEVSRRIELGLACSCISEEVYDRIKYQVVENAGIQDTSSKREGVDRSTDSDSFQPAKLIEYVRALALTPLSGADRLDLVIAKAQLLAFYRVKGFDALPDIQYFEGLMECDAKNGEVDLVERVIGVDSETRLRSPHKRKHNLKDIVYKRRREKSLTELIGEKMYDLDGEFDSHEEDDVMLTSPTFGTKRKASIYLTDDFTAQQSTKTISLAKVSQTASSNPPQQSFKVGECIRRVASQLTGSPSIIKAEVDEINIKHSKDVADEDLESPNDSETEKTTIPSKESSLDDMLSQLQLSARDPMKGYSFFSEIIRFFSEFRNLAVSTQRQKMRKGPGRKRKSSTSIVGSPETFEYHERNNDSYWTDMVVQNNPEAKPSSRRGRKRKDEQLVDPEKPVQSNRRKYSRKQYFHGNHESTAEIPSGDDKKKKEELPTELTMNFSEVGCVPSVENLNKMFKRFGPLKESETEVDPLNNRASVVFKKRSDAEVAYSSAAMFNIFGSTVVNYQLNYTPSTTSALPSTDGQGEAT